MGRALVFDRPSLYYHCPLRLAGPSSRTLDCVVAAPLIVYFFVIFTFTLWITHRLGFGYKLASTQSFTAASNNFELAIAVAVATYGADSDQALASTVGPLIEVPVLLGLVYIVKWIGNKRRWAP
ncbi:hypothetical protein D6D24_10765 [Aureobasidium pullulans]|uniref:Arsenical-resistance protein ACR3 n=1 Tax=Aureobasidium pullulans TaxID=5580 RepID=A0A4S8UW16_AURPU|nr:hypothetical protein D6D24_10765 [Aureobasidium pullulans]